jgi:hypothetical protein
MASPSPSPSGDSASGRRVWYLVAGGLALVAAILLALLFLADRRGEVAIGGVAAASTVGITTTAPWVTTIPTATGSAPASAGAATGSAPASASTSTSASAATAPTLPSTPPPTPVGRGPDLGGGTGAPGDPQALPFTAGVALFAVGGLLAGRAMLLWRRRAHRRAAG